MSVTKFSCKWSLPVYNAIMNWSISTLIDFIFEFVIHPIFRSLFQPPPNPYMPSLCLRFKVISNKSYWFEGLALIIKSL